MTVFKLKMPMAFIELSPSLVIKLAVLRCVSQGSPLVLLDILLDILEVGLVSTGEG